MRKKVEFDIINIKNIQTCFGILEKVCFLCPFCLSKGKLSFLVVPHYHSWIFFHSNVLLQIGLQGRVKRLYMKYTFQFM